MQKYNKKIQTTKAKLQIEKLTTEFELWTDHILNKH